MDIRLGLSAALLALLAAPLDVNAAAPEWRMVTTPHFRVLSQAGDKQTQLWVRNYEQFILTTSKAVGIEPDDLPPLTVVLFARDKDFTPYKVMRDGKAARVAGQFMPLAGISAIAMAADADQDGTRHVIYHESTHWLMSRDRNRHPTWFTEGIAEMLSTFELNGSKVNWAKPIDSHLIQLQKYGLLPLEDFLARTDSLQDQEKDDNRYYPQSWAFVHFLMLSQPSRVQMLDRILVESRNTPSAEAVRKVFGADLAALEKDFNHYVQQASFSFFSFASAAIPDPPPSVPAPPAIVEGALGFMALAVGKPDLARQHAKRAVELAGDLPDGHEVMALLARQDQDEGAVRAHAEAAVRCGTRSREMYLMVANALAQERAGGFQAAAAASIPLLKKAIELDPVRRAYRQLAYNLMFYEKPAMEDLRPLEQGLLRFPDDDWIKVGVAAARMRLGEGDALPVIRAALRPDSTLTSNERRNVGNLLMQAMEAELKIAQEKNDLDAARAIIARYRQAAGDDTELAENLQRRDRSFEMSQLVARMNATLGTGNTAELNRIFDQILAHPAVTPQLRNFIATQRQRIGK